MSFNLTLHLAALFSYQATLKRQIEIHCIQQKKKTTTRNHGDERQILLFILCEKNVNCCCILTNSPHVTANNCKLCNAVSDRLCEGFALYNVTLLGICSSILTKWVKVRLLQWKSCLFSLKYIFEFLTNTALLYNVDLSKMQPCKYFVYMDWWNPSQECRVNYANSNYLWHFLTALIWHT